MAQPDQKKVRTEPTKRIIAGQCSRESQTSRRETVNSRNILSASTLENRQKEIRNLVPTNIRHKYGSSVVENLLSPEQVIRCLREVQTATQHTQEHGIFRHNMHSRLTQDYPRTMYDELGQCLRSNLFPGVPITQKSMTHVSYTAEVNEKGMLDKYSERLWYGRKTDDLVVWSQMLMKRNAIDKILQSQPKPSITRRRPAIRNNCFQDVPAPLPPPREKSRKSRQQAKTIKSDVQPPPVTQPKEEDDFWDFYDKPIQ